MSAPRPIPAVTPDLAPFFAAAREGRLVIPRCRSCGAWRYPPRPTCPPCGSGDFAWEPVAGTGEVYSFTVLHQVYHPGFADEVPYAVVLVQLDEGVRMISNVVGVPASQVRIGQRVRVIFDPVSEEVTLPKFVLADASGESA